MKKGLFFISLISLLVFLGCDNLTHLEVPKSISIKSTGARYDIPLGEGAVLIREKMSASELREKFNENLPEGSPKIKVYDYNPTGNDKDVLQYLLKYPIEDIPLSLCDEDTDMKSMDIDSQISIPDINNNIRDAFSFVNQTYSISELGVDAAIPGNIAIDFKFNSPSFKTMEVNSGTLKLNLVKTSGTPTPGFSANAKLVLCNTRGDEIAASSAADITDGGLITLNVAGKTLVPSMKIKLVGNLSGGVIGNILTYDVSMSTDDLTLSKITGLTMSTADLGDVDGNPMTPDGYVAVSNDFDFKGMNDSLVSATIKSGTLDFYCMLPEGWKGITCTANLALTGAVAIPSFTDKPKAGALFSQSASLDGVSVSAGTTTLSGAVAFELNDATIIFDAGSSATTVELKGRCSVDEIEEMEINVAGLNTISGDLDTGLSFSTLLEKALGDASSLIKNVEFKGVEGYVYAVQPELSALSGLEFNGSITASYSGKTQVLVSSEDFSMASVPVDFDELANNDTFTITDGTIFDAGKYSIKTKPDSICTVLNDMPENLKIVYSIASKSATSTLHFTNGEINTLMNMGAASIQVFLIIQIPLEFVINDVEDYSVDPANPVIHEAGFVIIEDALKLAKNEIEEDLFKRDNVDDKAKWQDYVNLIKSFTITYENRNNTGLEATATFVDDASSLSKDLVFNTKKETFSISKAELKNIFNTYPFKPRILTKIKADGSVKTIPRNGKFGLFGYITVVTDGTVEVWSK